MTKTIERSDHIRLRFGIANLGMLAYGFSTDHGPDPHVCFIRSENERKEGEEDAGKEPSGKCANCGHANDDNAKFCDQCGKSMAAKPLEDEAPPESKPPSSKNPDSTDERRGERKDESAAHPPPPERMTAPRRMSQTASTASILGANADTPLAIKTAAIEMRAERDWLKATLAGITGKDDIAEMIGAALNIPGKLAAGKKAAADLAKVKATADETERWQLADRLVKAQPHMRSKVFADLHDDAGNRTTDRQTGRSVRIRSKYGPEKMDLGTLRGIVTDLEGDAPKKRAHPFEADREASRAASEAGASAAGIGGPAGVPRLTEGEPSAADVERAKRHPIVIKAAGGPGADPKRLEIAAKQFVIAAATNGVAIGGAA